MRLPPLPPLSQGQIRDIGGEIRRLARIISNNRGAIRENNLNIQIIAAHIVAQIGAAPGDYQGLMGRGAQLYDAAGAIANWAWENAGYSLAIDELNQEIDVLWQRLWSRR